MANVVCISGRLAKDPTLSEFSKEGGSKNMRAIFMVASPNHFGAKSGDKSTVDYVPCVAYGDTARNLFKFCKKGDEVTITGSVESRWVPNNQVGNGAQSNILMTKVRANTIDYGMKAAQNQIQDMATRSEKVKNILCSMSNSNPPLNPSL